MQGGVISESHKDFCKRGQTEHSLAFEHLKGLRQHKPLANSRSNCMRCADAVAKFLGIAVGSLLLLGIQQCVIMMNENWPHIVVHTEPWTNPLGESDHIWIIIGTAANQ